MMLITGMESYMNGAVQVVNYTCGFPVVTCQNLSAVKEAEFNYVLTTLFCLYIEKNSICSNRLSYNHQLNDDTITLIVLG